MTPRDAMPMEITQFTCWRDLFSDAKSTMLRAKGTSMRQMIFRGVCIGLVVPALLSAVIAQTDAAALFKARCSLCHAENGSGESPSGKALKARDLRSNEVQTKSDAELTESITKGKGKMPAFGQKLKPEQIQQLVAYIHQLKK